MTHRAPLSLPSTTHEPWPLIPHMWVWEAIAMATAVSTEAFARCHTWICRMSAFESVCRCTMTVVVVEGCERKCAVDASRVHSPVCIWRLAACIHLEPARSKGSLSEWRKSLWSIFPQAFPPNHSSATKYNPPTLLNPHVKLMGWWAFYIEIWKTLTIKNFKMSKGVELCLGAVCWAVLVTPGDRSAF